MRFLTAAALVLLVALPAHADGVYVKYHVNFLGIKVGEGKLSVAVNSDGYKIGGDGSMAAFGRLVSDARASVSSSGATTSDVLKPNAFHMNAVDDGKPNKVDLALNKGSVTSQSIFPPQDKMDQRIKVEDAHRKGVIDPLSAIVFPAPKGLSPESCNRTLKIYDGRERYDLVLKYKSTYKQRGSSKNYSGTVLVCSARYKPIAGHRPNRKTIKQLQANKSMEIHLAQINDAPYLLLYKASLNTPAGPASVNAVKMKFSN